MNRLRRKSVALLLFGLFALSLLTGCATTVPREALQLSPEELEKRQVQSRRFETADEGKILSACAALLQDTGFSIEETETELGVLLGSKDRSAVSAGQICASILMAALFGAYVPTDKSQRMRASVITRPAGEENIVVRVTFQRVVWNTQGQVTRREGIEDAEIYQGFFDKLSKSVFLEAHSI